MSCLSGKNQILAQAADGRVLAARLRGLPADIDRRDPGLARALGMPGPLFGGSRGLVIGSELARYLNVAEGDSILVLGVTSDPQEGLGTRSLRLPIRAIFHSGYYDFDANLAFIEEGEGLPLFSPADDSGLSWGIKLKDRYRGFVLCRPPGRPGPSRPRAGGITTGLSSGPCGPRRR